MAPISRFLKLASWKLNMLDQMGASLTILIFSQIWEPLPHEPHQPVLHGPHDDGHAKSCLYQGFHVCLWSQDDAYIITFILLTRSENPFLMIVVNLSSMDVMMMAMPNITYIKGFMYVYGVRKKHTS